MGEFHDLHLTSDLLLLADVFENFRKTCMQQGAVINNGTDRGGREF